MSLFCVVLSTDRASFESIDHIHRFMRYRKVGDRYKVYTLRIMSNDQRKKSTFRIVNGLAASSKEGAISFESIDEPDYFVRQTEDGRIVLDKRGDSLEFAESATFWLRSANALPGNDRFCSFQSFSDKNMFIREKDFKLEMGSGDTIRFKRESTFKVDRGNWEDDDI